MDGKVEGYSYDNTYRLTAIAQTGAECLEIMQRSQPDVALIDVNISQPEAAHILREVKANFWKTRICFLIEDQLPTGMLEAGKEGSAVFVNERFPEDLRDRLHEIAIDLLGKKRRLEMAWRFAQPRWRARASASD
jgi:DNA-binding NarL/FixJ family response regulator